MHWAALCLGMVLCAALPTLSYAWVVGISAGTILLAHRYRPIRLGLWLCFGFVYALWRFQTALNQQIPVNAPDSAQTAQITVLDIASGNERSQQFTAHITTSQKSFRVTAHDYQHRRWPVGSVWRCAVRLRSNIGMVNASGFNSEQWALANRMDGSASIGLSCQHLRQHNTPTIWVNQWRERAWMRLSHLPTTHQQGVALVAALSVGLQDGLNDDTWWSFRQLGIVHLISISGVHVTMLALLVAWLVGKLLRYLPHQVATPMLWQLWSGVAVAFAYALLAGFQVPTQRTVWMLLVFALAMTWRRQVSPWQVWVMALAVVLLLQATAVLSVGLWLSFALVAVMLWAQQTWQRQGAHKWRSALRAQLAALLLTWVLVGSYFHSVPLFSSLANSIAIPWFSWVLTPLALLASVLPWDAPLLWVVALAQTSIDVGVWAAAWSPQWVVAQTPWYVVALALVAVVVVMLPAALGLRIWGVLVVLLLVVYRPPVPEHGQLRVHMVDVGQGLSLLLQTQHHGLVFDTGRGNANSVLLPALQSQGWSNTDALVLSHHDADHDGAAASLWRQFRFQTVWAGQPEAYPDWRALSCRQHSWQWDGVWFEWLTLPRQQVANTTNAQSCVLRVVTSGQALLLPADIGQDQERQLLAQYGGQLHSTVLVLGHHGSSSSNSSAWLNTVAPTLAIASSGWRNAYHHPTQTVQTRLQAHGIELYRTDEQGALVLVLDQNLRTEPFAGRRYWWQRKPQQRP